VINSISIGAQYVTLQKYFSHPSLVISFFPTPPHKTKTGTANTWETTSTNPRRPIKLSNQSTAGQQQVLGFAVPRTSLGKVCKNAPPNQHVLTFLHPILICRFPY